MYDIYLKNVKKGRFFFYIFLLAGIFFFCLLVSTFIFNTIRLKTLDSSIMSSSVDVYSYTNEDGDIMYKSIYYYNVDGREYKCSSSVSTGFEPIKENKTVYFDSNNPSKCVTEDSKSMGFLWLLALLIPIVFIITGIVGILKINKRLKLIKELNKNGKLIKNLPYRLEDSNFSVNNVPLQKPVIDYTLPNGITITLYGDTRHDKKYYDSDGKVDLIIDENNPENYYIDFEINRLSGNLPNDYYYEKRSEISYCVNCGNQVDPNFKFCKKCGKEQ
jgi:hypothetical protein